jgi:hypothetical protein
MIFDHLYVTSLRHYHPKHPLDNHASLPLDYVVCSSVAALIYRCRTKNQ